MKNRVIFTFLPHFFSKVLKTLRWKDICYKITSTVKINTETTKKWSTLTVNGKKVTIVFMLFL